MPSGFCRFLVFKENPISNIMALRYMSYRVLAVGAAVEIGIARMAVSSQFTWFAAIVKPAVRAEQLICFQKGPAFLPTCVGW
jgi:hypothetical protein